MSTNANEIESVTIKNVLDRIENIWQNEDKTPLILSESGLMDRFYIHRDVNIIDAKALFLKEKMQKIPREDLLEEMRKKLVNSMKYGKTLVLSMQNSAADISGTYNGANTFPVPEVFCPSKIVQERVWKDFVKPEDMDHETTNIKFFQVEKTFQVVIISQFSKDDYASFLQDSLPLAQCKPIVLQEN